MAMQYFGTLGLAFIYQKNCDFLLSFLEARGHSEQRKDISQINCILFAK